MMASGVRAATAIVAVLSSTTLLISTVTHHTAEGTIVDELLGLEDYAGFGHLAADIFSGMRKDLHSPLPEAVSKQAVDGDKKPTPWPKVFHAKIQFLAKDRKVLVHSYYDYPNGRMMNIVIPPLPTGHTSLLIEDARRRPDSYSEMMKRTIRAFEQSGEPDGMVDRLNGNLFFPDTALWMRLEHFQLATYSKKAPICVIRDFPRDIVPPPDMLADARFLRQETVEGILCNVFEKGSEDPRTEKQKEDGELVFKREDPFLLLYENASTGVPVKYVFLGKAEMNFKSFEPNGTLESNEWEIPFYCQDENNSMKRGLPILQ